MDDRESMQRTLARAKRALQIIEEEAAGFGALHIPADLKIELEEKRSEVASLEARLAQMAGGKPQSVPDNLPNRAVVFVGRKEEMARCLEALTPEERGWGVTIDGIGGVGKTALAVEVACEARRRAWFDAYLYASAKTSWLTPEGVRQETLALSSLDAFGREFARLLGETDVARMTDAAERRRALLDSLRGRRALLIWDNLETLTAEERDQIAEFLRKLPGANKAIITSRYRTGESALSLRLGQLAEREAFELMAGLGRRNTYLGAELARGGAALQQRLYELAGGNPLAIHQTLGLVAQKGYTLAAAVERLGDAARSPDLYAFLFASAARDLAASDRTVLSALSAFQTPATAAALADATGLTSNETGIAVGRLVTLSLVNEVEGGRYGLHPLTRTYVRAAFGAGSEVARTLPGGVALDPAARRKALRYWVDYAGKHGGGSQNYQTFDRLEAEWPNLEAAASALYELTGLPGALRDQEAGRMLNDLATALRSFLQFRGYWDERTRIAGWAYEAMKALADWREAGWRAFDVSFIHFLRGETDRATAWADLAAEAWRRGGDRREQAAGAQLRGLVARQRGDLAEAERLLGEALAAYRELGGTADEAMVLNDLGGVAQARKEYGRAEGYYRQASTIAEKAGNRERQSIYAGSLGSLALDLGRPAEARPWLERELELAREVGRQDLIAHAQYGLARVLEAEGRYREALPLAEEALRIYERLRDRNLEVTRQWVERLRSKV